VVFWGQGSIRCAADKRGLRESGMVDGARIEADA
jgi:hypothetical protein